MSLQRGFLASCRSEKIPENIAKELAETFMEEKGGNQGQPKKQCTFLFQKPTYISSMQVVKWPMTEGRKILMSVQ